MDTIAIHLSFLSLPFLFLLALMLDTWRGAENVALAIGAEKRPPSLKRVSPMGKGCMATCCGVPLSNNSKILFVVMLLKVLVTIVIVIGAIVSSSMALLVDSLHQVRAREFRVRSGRGMRVGRCVAWCKEAMAVIFFRIYPSSLSSSSPLGC